MFEKNKNGASNPRRRILWVGVGLLIALASGAIGYNISPKTVYIPAPVNTPMPIRDIPVTNETVILPLNKAEPTLTTGTYQGAVVMVVSGTGRVNDEQFNDAFYTFADKDGQYDNTPELQVQTQLELDGQLAYNLMQGSSTLFYSQTHTYLIRYDAGPTPRHIALGLSHFGDLKNSGQFEVMIFSDMNWNGSVASFVPTQVPQPIVSTEGGEAIIVPFTSGSPVYTETLYTGRVTLVIRGTGQAGGADSSDAFYLYERGDHTPYVPPVLGDFAMELDGQVIHKALNFAPDYAWDHVYRVNYDVGSQLRRIGFRNTDLTTGDNTGTYYVEVIPEG